MATPLSKIVDIINTLKSDEAIFANEDIPINHASLGVTQASIMIGENWDVTIDRTVTPPTGLINADLTTKQTYLCGLYAFRNYISQEHHKLMQKAVNFKTINFAVTGLTERAKEAMRIIWWTDGEIERVLTALIEPMGGASEMRGDS